MIELGNQTLRKFVKKAVNEVLNGTSYKCFGLNFIVWKP